MLLFQKRFHQGLVNGSVTLTFRLWDKPRVKPKGRYRVHPIGVVEVDALSQVPLRSLSERDARSAGFDSLVEMLAYIKEAPRAEALALTPSTLIYRVELHHAGDGDRVEAALDTVLTPTDVEALEKRLARFDAQGEWTRQTLELIQKFPQVAASKLALKVGRETEPFKVDVRKLKRLGLTQSFEVGYEVSPRGREFMKRVYGSRQRATQKRKS